MTRVIGLEWEAADVGQEPPTIFGQTVPLLAGHPGIPEPHYMLHAYFRPNGQVLFAEFDPLVSCAMPGTSTVAPGEPDPDRMWLLMLVLLGTSVVMTLIPRRRGTD